MSEVQGRLKPVRMGTHKEDDKEWNELFRCVAKMVISSHAASDAESAYRNQRYEIRQILMGYIDENEEVNQ